MFLTTVFLSVAKKCCFRIVFLPLAPICPPTFFHSLLQMFIQVCPLTGCGKPADYEHCEAPFSLLLVPQALRLTNGGGGLWNVKSTSNVGAVCVWQHIWVSLFLGAGLMHFKSVQRSNSSWTAETAGMWSFHYVDRLLTQPSNWLPGPAPVPQGFISLIGNRGFSFFFFCCNTNREEETILVLVLHFIISSRVLHSLFCYVGVVQGFWRPSWRDAFLIRDRKAYLRLGEATVLVMFFLLLLLHLRVMLLLLPVFSSLLAVRDWEEILLVCVYELTDNY